MNLKALTAIERVLTHTHDETLINNFERCFSGRSKNKQKNAENIALVSSTHTFAFDDNLLVLGGRLELL